MESHGREFRIQMTPGLSAGISSLTVGRSFRCGLGASALLRLRCFAKPPHGLRLTEKRNLAERVSFRSRAAPFPEGQCNDNREDVIFPRAVPLGTIKPRVFAEARFMEARFVEVRLLRVTRRLHLPRCVAQSRHACL